MSFYPCHAGKVLVKRVWDGFRRVWWSGRPIIHEVADTRQSTLIITPQRAQRPRNPPSSMGSSCDTPARMVRSAVLLVDDVCNNPCGRCVGDVWGGDPDRFTNPTEGGMCGSNEKTLCCKCQQRAFNFFEASALKTVAMDSGRFPRSRAGHLASA